MATRTSIDQRAQKLLRVVDSVKAKLPSILQKASSRFSFSGNYYSQSSSYTSTFFDILPAELQVEIFSNCCYQDLLSLRLTSWAFKNLIDANENAIVRKMVTTCEYTTLSGLFPPRKSQARAPRYTIRYIHLLHKHHNTCSDLAYHLADRAVESAFRKSSRRDKKEVAEMAIQRIQEYLTGKLYYVYHFLLFTNMEAANLEYKTLVEDVDLRSSYQNFQTLIISKFPNTVLISTHHVMTFLVNTIRLCICVEPPYNRGDAMVSLLLRSPSSLKRILEFFQADSRGSSRNTRKSFMLTMQKEREEAERNKRPLRLKETWFEAAKGEMAKRGLQGHEPELYKFSGFPTIRVGCPMCQDG